MREESCFCSKMPLHKSKVDFDSIVKGRASSVIFSFGIITFNQNLNKWDMKVRKTRKDSIKTDTIAAKLVATKTTVKYWEMLQTSRKDMHLYCFSNIFKFSL